MGSYLNPGCGNFRMALRSEIFIDKSLIIEETNRRVSTMQRFMCVSRPRRFGKSMAADMLAAYYDNSEDASGIFEGLDITKTASYREHLNCYDVIKVNMQEFLSMSENVDEMIELLQSRVTYELKNKYPEYVKNDNKLMFAMKDIFSANRKQFIVLIDEWDCLFREYKNDSEAQKRYLDFLRMWLKDQEYIALAYMTGILPVKKYGSHSALNMFTEYSMTDPGALAEYFGFTEDEVRELCRRYNMDFDEAKAWYDGYGLINHTAAGDRRYSMYSPRSVVEAMMKHKFGTYWNQTETYEALKLYIQMDIDGLKDAVIAMLGGESLRVDTGTFSNDMTTFSSRDDVLTLLVHLGYLTYDSDKESVSVPNREVSIEYVNAIKTMDWNEVMRSISESRGLLEALWNMDGDAVAAAVERAHSEIPVLQYNDENSLSCAVNLAFYAAREYYSIIREFPAGKGFADICFVPRKLYSEKPAAVIELKWDKDAVGAIRQIKERKYIEAFKDHSGEILLVGINYDKKTKKHECIIEKAENGVVENGR